MHDDSDVIQASTHGNIRLPRLWANSKDMKTDTYSDRFSTTCRNDSTMSSNRTSNKNGNRLQREGNSCLKSSVSGRQQNGVSHRGTTSHSRAYVHHTTVLQSGDQSGDSTMHLAAAPLRSSNQTRNQRHRRLFSYLDRASYAPRVLGHTFYFSARPAPSPLSNDPVFPLFTPPFADNLPFYEDT